MEVMGLTAANSARGMHFIKEKHQLGDEVGVDFLRVIKKSNPPVHDAILELNPRRIQVDTENQWALVLKDNSAVQRWVEEKNDPTWYLFDYSQGGSHQPIYQNTTREQCKEWLSQQLNRV